MTAVSYSWHLRAFELRVAFHCLACGARRVVQFPARHELAGGGGASGPARAVEGVAAARLLDRLGDADVEHHRAALPAAALAAGRAGGDRLGSHVGPAPERLDVGPFAVFVDECSTLAVGRPLGPYAPSLEAYLRADDPSPLGTLAQDWRGRPHEGEAAAVASLALGVPPASPRDPRPTRASFRVRVAPKWAQRRPQPSRARVNPTPSPPRKRPAFRG